MAKTTGEAAEVAEDFRGFSSDELKDRIKTVELSSLGQTLPIGVWIQGERHTEVTLQELSAEQEILLGRQQKNLSGEKAVNFIAEFMARLVTHIGGIPIGDVAKELGYSAGGTPDVKRLMKGMYLADILALVCLAKLETSGPTVAMAGTCERCGTENRDDPDDTRHMHSIEGVDFKVWNDSKPPVLRYQLQAPIPHGEEMGPIEYLQLHPLRYHHLAKVTGNKAKDTLDLEMLFRMVRKIEHPAYESARGEVFDVTLFNAIPSRAARQLLKSQVRKLDLMPDLEGEMVCSNCSHEWQAPIPWADLATFLCYMPELAA